MCYFKYLSLWLFLHHETEACKEKEGEKATVRRGRVEGFRHTPEESQGGERFHAGISFV